jgi:hypothetical protein
MRRVGAVLITLLLLAGAQGVAAQGQGNGYVPYTETIVIDSTVAGWQNTGIVLIDGMAASISATGTASCDVIEPIFAACTNVLGPEGLVGTTAGGFPVWLAPGLPRYSLVARIDGGTPFVLGTEPLVITGSGELQLGYNDQQGLYGDNAGQFTVTVTSCRPGVGTGDTNHCHSGAPGQG